MKSNLNLNSNALRLLNLLSEDKKWTITELSDEVGIERSSTHYWLKKFIKMDLIKKERKYGKHLYYFGEGEYSCVKGTIIEKKREKVIVYGCPYADNCEVKEAFSKGCKLREEIEEGGDKDE